LETDLTGGTTSSPKVNHCFLEQAHHHHMATKVPGECLGRSR